MALQQNQTTAPSLQGEEPEKTVAYKDITDTWALMGKARPHYSRSEGPKRM